MKKYAALILVLTCFLIFAGCGSAPDTPDSANTPSSPGTPHSANTPSSPEFPDSANTPSSPESPDSANMPSDSENGNAQTSDDARQQTGTEQNPADKSASPDPEAETFVYRLRIADGAQSGNLILAGENHGDLLTLSPDSSIPVFLDGQEADASVLEDGMLLDIVYDGMLLETYPAQFGQVFSIQAYSLGSAENPGGGYYDLCGLYLQVLNDLWDKDPGLNSDAEYVSLDLSQAPGGLSEGEKAAIAWIFAGRHGATSLSWSYEELAENGYLSEINLDSEHKIYQWENGILFTITPVSPESHETYSLPALQFNAEKWRSPTGAYIFSDCFAIWPEMGTWSNYEIGSEMIS